MPDAFPCRPEGPRGGGAAADAGAPGGADAGVAVPDEETPQAEGPQELQELDDEEVPLAGMEGGDAVAGGIRHMAGAVAIAGAAGIALLAMLILWIRRRKKDPEGEQ